MSRTTPPRPVDIASVFPELAPSARQAVRLHPRAGRPTVHDSSVGGPLLWPADETWPTCAKEHHNGNPPVSLDDIRRRRALLDAAWLRPREPREHLLDPGERAYFAKLQAGHPAHTEPNALLPVAQLHLRDVPGLAGPEGADLLQVLWCPLDHHNGLPAARLVRRNAASVGELLTDPPEPADVEHYGGYVPAPCVLHPEAVTEYPAPHELPEELADRLYAWGEEQEEDPEEGLGGAYYQYELSVAPGWKVGGWAPWGLCDPKPMHCDACNARYEPLFTIDSGESNGGSGSWTPLKDLEEPSGPTGLRTPADAPMVKIGRGCSMQIYVCPTSFDHPHLEVMQ
ncbi:hypothetical protein [Streptomyces triticiradicis]|uniref:DUF1963 domain-containing protein n=1 Tax=Streptomyces triticiradicis TaxID=2651189 RepID=A0A7J5DJP5_9ACTN|nr:hypothetical protein [Streptomyces triticiradicis]KAB1988881.1 hypothetical protein F8144_10025 [Streptomyces triticiradicis]